MSRLRCCLSGKAFHIFDNHDFYVIDGPFNKVVTKLIQYAGGRVLLTANADTINIASVIMDVPEGSTLCVLGLDYIFDSLLKRVMVHPQRYILHENYTYPKGFRDAFRGVFSAYQAGHSKLSQSGRNDNPVELTRPPLSRDNPDKKSKFNPCYQQNLQKQFKSSVNLNDKSSGNSNQKNDNYEVIVLSDSDDEPAPVPVQNQSTSSGVLKKGKPVCSAADDPTGCNSESTRRVMFSEDESADIPMQKQSASSGVLKKDKPVRSAGDDPTGCNSESTRRVMFSEDEPADIPVQKQSASSCVITKDKPVASAGDREASDSEDSASSVYYGSTSNLGKNKKTDRLTAKLHGHPVKMTDSDEEFLQQAKDYAPTRCSTSNLGKNKKSNGPNAKLHGHSGKKTDSDEEFLQQAKDYAVPKAPGRSKFRQPYSVDEKILIVTYIRDYQLHSCVKGNEMWKAMEKKKIVKGGRTWQSLMEHFKKKILPNINDPIYKDVLSQDQKKLFEDINCPEKTKSMKTQYLSLNFDKQRTNSAREKMQVSIPSSSKNNDEITSLADEDTAVSLVGNSPQCRKSSHSSSISPPSSKEVEDQAPKVNCKDSLEASISKDNDEVKRLDKDNTAVSPVRKSLRSRKSSYSSSVSQLSLKEVQDKSPEVSCKGASKATSSKVVRVNITKRIARGEEVPCPNKRQRTLNYSCSSMSSELGSKKVQAKSSAINNDVAPRALRSKAVDKKPSGSSASQPGSDSSAINANKDVSVSRSVCSRDVNNIESATTINNSKKSMLSRKSSGSSLTSEQSPKKIKETPPKIIRSPQKLRILHVNTTVQLFPRSIEGKLKEIDTNVSTIPKIPELNPLLLGIKQSSNTCATTKMNREVCHQIPKSKKPTEDSSIADHIEAEMENIFCGVNVKKKNNVESKGGREVSTQGSVTAKVSVTGRETSAKETTEERDQWMDVLPIDSDDSDIKSPDTISNGSGRESPQLNEHNQRHVTSVIDNEEQSSHSDDKLDLVHLSDFIVTLRSLKEPALDALASDLVSGKCPRCANYTVYSELNLATGGTGNERNYCPNCIELGNEIEMNLMFHLVLEVEIYHKFHNLTLDGINAQQLLGCTEAEFLADQTLRRRVLDRLILEIQAGVQLQGNIVCTSQFDSITVHLMDPKRL